MTSTNTKRSTARRLVLACVLSVLAAFWPAAAGAAAPSYDEAVKQLVSLGYPQSVETYLSSLGANPLGFRLAGTEAEHAASEYVAAELRDIGLKNVRLEPVPVDAYELLGASVTVGTRSMTASQFPGIPGTPPEGITGGVVYVHDGTAADFDAAGDVHGKIVLVDSALEYFWLNSPGAEATVRGATAVVYTYGPHSYPWYAIAPDALGTNDGEYMDSWVPLVYLSRQDGDWLKGQLEDGPTTATVTSSVKVTPHDFDHPEAGGVGYNVVAELPGTSDDDSFVLVTSHLDAHFRCGLDDTGALVSELTMAKAMVMSGAKPRHTVVFLFTCGEEYGYGNAYFDYLAGAWWAISHTHPDWAGEAVAMLNLECFARPGVATADTTPDLARWLRAVAKQRPGLVPWGLEVSPVKSSWDDGWPLLAAGVPSVTLAATGDDFWERYHSTWETKETVDWQYLGKLTRFVGALQRSLDTGLLPYDLQARARGIKASVPADELRLAGVPAAEVRRVTQAAKGFTAAVDRFTARKSAIPASRVPDVNEGLLSVIDDVCSNLTGLSAWEDTVYPHQQVLWDVLSLNATLAELDRATPRPQKALKALTNVGKTAYGLAFSPEVYAQDLERLEPDYPVLTWGALGHLAPQLNVLEQYRMIEAGQYASAVGGAQTDAGCRPHRARGAGQEPGLAAAESHQAGERPALMGGATGVRAGTGPETRERRPRGRPSRAPALSRLPVDYLPCTESTIAFTFSNLALGGMAQPIAMMNPSGPTSVEQPVAVGLDLVHRAERQHRRWHVAHQAHVAAEDLLGAEEVGLPVGRQHARPRRQLQQTLDLAVPVGVVVQHRDAALLGHDLHELLHVRPDEAVPEFGGEELRRGAPAPDPVAERPDGADHLARLLALLGHDGLHHRLDLVRTREQVHGEFLDGAAAAEVLVRVVDGRGAEHDVAAPHELADPARPLLLKLRAGRGGLAQVRADVLPEPRTPAHLQDAVVVLRLDADLLVELPEGVVGQVAAGELHRGQPEHPEDRGGIAGPLHGVDVAELLRGGEHRLAGHVEVGAELRVLHAHRVAGKGVQDQGERHAVGRAAVDRGLDAAHALEEERVGGRCLGHVSSPPARSWRRSRRPALSCSSGRRSRSGRPPRSSGRPPQGS